MAVSPRPGDPRRRLIDGFVAAAAERGYPATTVTDVVRRAGMSRATFYGQFRDREACFVAALEDRGDRCVAELGAAARSGDASLVGLARALVDAVGRDDGWLVRALADADAAGGEPRATRGRLLERAAAAFAAAAGGGHREDLAVGVVVLACVAAAGEAGRGQAPSAVAEDLAAVLRRLLGNDGAALVRAA